MLQNSLMRANLHHLQEFRGLAANSRHTPLWLEIKDQIFIPCPTIGLAAIGGPRVQLGGDHHCRWRRQKPGAGIDYNFVAEEVRRGLNYGLSFLHFLTATVVPMVVFIILQLACIDFGESSWNSGGGWWQPARRQCKQTKKI